MTKKKKKRSLVVKIIMAFVLVIVIAMVAVSAYLAYGIYTEFNSSGEGTDETVILEIEPGESVWDIAAKLQEKDLIKYQVSFYLKAKDTGLSGKLRYGEFAIRKGTGLANILKILTSGGAWKDSAMFTVPEGYTIELIARRLERDGICTAAEFLEAVELEYDYWFLKDIPEVEGIKYKLQGFLYPETYAISKDMDAEDIVRVMLNQFDKMFTQEMREKLESSGKTVFEIVTAASIIERETVIQSEKPIMAGVIANRLAIDMKLQM